MNDDEFRALLRPEQAKPEPDGMETLRLDRWHHPTPDRYYTGDARMPAPPMSMLRPMVRLLAGG